MRHPDGAPDKSRAASAVPIAPSLGAELPGPSRRIDRRTVAISGIALVLGAAAAGAAQVLVALIDFITGLAFHGRASLEPSSPFDHQLGAWVVLVPVAGAFVIGLMARYGSAAIRGHGIPEAMENVLTQRSRIPARITLLKPVSAAISIGTGGPFGAEGPIIATGGALGSLVGQVLAVASAERKTLLAAGAAAGMSATFGTPISAVLLAVELLLFEYRVRSLIPVALASAAAATVRLTIHGAEPEFVIDTVSAASALALLAYVLLGAVTGALAVLVTKAVYAIEDVFERLPIHWMWWPMLGAIVVGVVGYVEPRTLGVGYENISALLTGALSLKAIAVLSALKLVSWSVSLGSGTSGGTLAPLFTIGGGIGALQGAAIARWLPVAHVHVGVAALVGMASMFAGASHALLASIVFAFETTEQVQTLLPLLAGGTAGYLVSSLSMRRSIMTEKISRRGIAIPSGYASDPLEQLHVRDAASPNVVTLRETERLGDVRARLESQAPDWRHQGYPVLDERGFLRGVLTRRDLLDTKHADDAAIGSLVHRLPCLVYDDCTLREAVEHMLRHDVGRLPVVSRAEPSKLVGIVTRSDLLSAYRHRLEENRPEHPVLGPLKPRPRQPT